MYDNHISIYRAEDNKLNSTCHLIIDEAHNMLSEQLTHEAESFKDYRLDIFEKIIKEGRKFGFLFNNFKSKALWHISNFSFATT